MHTHIGAKFASSPSRAGNLVRVAGALAGVALLAASCSQSGSASKDTSAANTSSASSPAPSPTVAPDQPGMDKFYAQRAQWGSCAGFEMSDPPAPHMQCARVLVPIDYANPDGPTAKIALSRLTATGNKTGSVLFNPGGPGQPGIGMPAQFAKSPLREHFDLVGFDPRGVNASEPAVHCLTPKETDEKRRLDDVDTSPAGIAKTEQDTKDFIAKCQEHTGNELLAHLGTREVARDLDILRSAVGDPKLTYVGYSYGTLIGSQYAQAFPDKVRALVLDGAIDPQQDPMDTLIKQNQGFEKAFETYAADCAKKSNCPLGTDPAKAATNFQALSRPLIGHPVHTDDGRPLGYSDALTGVTMALYSPDLWTALTKGLRELQQGNGTTLLALADVYEGRNPNGTYANQSEAFVAIRCVDSPRVTDRARVGQIDTQLRQIAPFADDGHGSGHAALDTCAFWPVPVTMTPAAVNAPGLPRVVVVSTTHDPATPYQAGVDLAKQLHAELITFNGTQHTVSLQGQSSCVDDAVVKYLNTAEAPAQPLTCS